MYREPVCTGRWVLRNTLILLDVHSEVEKCDKRKRQKGSDRTAQLGSSGSNPGDPGDPGRGFTHQSLL